MMITPTSFDTVQPTPIAHAARSSRGWATSGCAQLWRLALAGTLLTTIAPVGAATFTDLGLGLEGQGRGTAAWADYDNDGDLDFVVSGALPSGKHATRLYANNGDGTFTLRPDFSDPGASLTSSLVAWGDYDNDGYLDLLVAGRTETNEKRTLLFHNDGGVTFSLVDANLPGVTAGAAAWGDYDNDGDLDLVLAGGFDTGRRSVIYRNDWGNRFTDIGAGLIGLDDRPAVAWGDYDNDGHLDLVIAGYTGSGLGPSAYVTKLYRNLGDQTFAETQVHLPGVSRASVGWGDYNNDGFLDLVLAGGNPFAITKIFRNERDGTFLEETATLPQVTFSSSLWGDLDNDGDHDLLLAGARDIGPAGTFLLANTGTRFADVRANLPGLLWSPGAWGDFDNDGDLDLVLSGSSTQDPATAILRVYRNDGPVPNTPPSAPEGLSVSVQGNSVTLSWSAASDPETPSAGLTYNVRVGSSPGAADIVSPAAGATGLRRLPAMGNAQQRRFLILRPNRSGTFYWSVQAIDTAFAGSPFAEEGNFSFTIVPEPPLAVTAPGTDVTARTARLNGYANPHGLAATAWFEWGTTINYGHSTEERSIGEGVAPVVCSQDLAELESLKVYHYRLNSSNAVGTVQGEDRTFITGFLEPLESNLPVSQSDWAAWGDYDQDGRLDVLVGRAFDPNRGTFIYHNDGNGHFRRVLGSLPTFWRVSVAWGDYDNDGDLDLAISGDSATASGPVPLSRIYRNDGNGRFTDLHANLAPSGAVAWGDYDNDGDLDLVIGASPTPRLYRNDGNDKFVGTSAGLPGFYAECAAWGDYNNDGDLDLFLGGVSGSRIFRNEGNGRFVGVSASLTGISEHCSAAWGDYDNDGDLDLLLAGLTVTTGGQETPVTKVYRNDAGQFVDIRADLTGVWDFASVAWGDYDNDGDLDILVAGNAYEGRFDVVRYSQVYRNDGGDTFTRMPFALPGVEVGLSVIADGSPYDGGRHANSVTWADVDHDGNLDILSVSSISRNVIERPNAPPAAPSALAWTSDGSTVTFSWPTTTDAETPSAGLRYNLRVGTTPGGSDVVSPTALVAAGNVGHRLSWTLKNAIEGQTYYWSVQAVDTADAVSAFAPEVAVTPRPLRIISSGAGFGFGTGRFGFSLSGSAGRPVVVETSTDLSNWIPIWTNTFDAGPLPFSDQQSADFSARFYRARSP